MALTEEQIIEKNQVILDEIGINILNYKDQESIEKVTNLLDPITLTKTILIKGFLLPIFLGMVIYITGFFMLDLVGWEYVVYGFVGFFILVFMAVFIGLIRASTQIQDKILDILEYSFHLLQSIINDSRNLGMHLQSENRAYVLGVLFKGILQIITIPITSTIIRKRIPFFGNRVSRFSEKAFVNVSNRIQFAEKKEEILLAKEEDDDMEGIASYLNIVGAVSKQLNRLLNTTMNIIRVPFYISFVVSFLILSLLIYFVGFR